MTSTLTVTDANRGEEVATNQAVVNVVLKKLPKEYTNEYLSFANSEGIIKFNMHLASSAVSIDSNVFSGLASFDSLVVHSIPTGCEVELELADPPTLTSLSPDTAESGSGDIVLTCTGTNFIPGTTIRFGPTYDEPTTFVSDTEVTTGVKPSLFAPAVVPVSVHTDGLWSDPVDFTFTEPEVVEP